ncbi:hypothetical protein INR49_029115, partial [Caranx melampygus]
MFDVWVPLANAEREKLMSAVSADENMSIPFVFFKFSVMEDCLETISLIFHLAYPPNRAASGGRWTGEACHTHLWSPVLAAVSDWSDIGELCVICMCMASVETTASGLSLPLLSASCA